MTIAGIGGSKLKARRRWPRLFLVHDATLTDASGRRLLGRTFDISRGGCFVDAGHPWPGGTPVRIGISNGEERFEVAARIVHAEADGMGIAFDEPMPQPQLKLLARWLTQSTK